MLDCGRETWKGVLLILQALSDKKISFTFGLKPFLMWHFQFLTFKTGFWPLFTAFKGSSRSLQQILEIDKYFLTGYIWHKSVYFRLCFRLFNLFTLFYIPFQKRDIFCLKSVIYLIRKGNYNMTWPDKIHILNWNILIGLFPLCIYVSSMTYSMFSIIHILSDLHISYVLW